MKQIHVCLKNKQDEMAVSIWNEYLKTLGRFLEKFQMQGNPSEEEMDKIRALEEDLQFKGKNGRIELVNILDESKFEEIKAKVKKFLQEIAIKEDLKAKAERKDADEMKGKFEKSFDAEASSFKIAAKNLLNDLFQLNSNDLVSIASKITEFTLVLSEFYKTEESMLTSHIRLKLLDSSMQIKRLVDSLYELVGKLCIDGNDSRNIRECRILADKLKTLTTQLKICVAVKVSNPSDNDSELQLNVCGTNLIACLRDLMKKCQVIRVIRGKNKE